MRAKACVCVVSLNALKDAEMLEKSSFLLRLTATSSQLQHFFITRI